MSSSSFTSACSLSPYFENVAGPDFFNRAEHFDDQHAVMRDDGAAAFADDVRVRHFLGVANVGDVINDVVRVFLQRVIRRAVERRAAAVVIHAQARRRRP